MFCNELTLTQDDVRQDSASVMAYIENNGCGCFDVCTKVKHKLLQM